MTLDTDHKSLSQPFKHLHSTSRILVLATVHPLLVKNTSFPVSFGAQRGEGIHNETLNLDVPENICAWEPPGLSFLGTISDLQYHAHYSQHFELIYKADISRCVVFRKELQQLLQQTARLYYTFQKFVVS